MAYQSLHSGELIFSGDALVTVSLACNAILEHVPCFGEQANNFEEPPFCVFLTRIRRKPDCLANRKFMGGHRISQHNVQHRLGKGGVAPCVPPYCARSATADVLPCWPRSTS